MKRQSKNGQASAGNDLNRQRATQGQTGPWFAQESTWHGLAFWICLLVLLCLHFSLTYIANPNFLNPESYLHGQAATPYQYRVLPMYVFRALDPLRIVEIVAHHAPRELNTPYEVVLLGMVFLGMGGAVFATQATVARITGDKVFARWISLLVVYMAYFNLAPHWGLIYTLPYDVPSLFFFCTGVYLVVSRRWWAFYLLFPVAVLNRETACFLTVFFLVWEWIREQEDSTPTARLVRLLPHLVAQGAIWYGIKVYLARRFAGNVAESGHGGSLFLGKFAYNVHELLKPQQWPVLLSVCGFLLPVLWIGRGWIRNRQMAWACGVVMGLWGLGMMLVGVIPEIRVFSELTAVAVPTLALIVHHRFRPVPGGLVTHDGA